jgi:hypothetical protein
VEANVTDVPFPPETTEWHDLLLDFWSCVPDPERSAALVLSDARHAGEAFAPQSTVKLAFELAAGGGQEYRWQAFVDNWNLIAATIPTEPEPTEAFLTLNLWIGNLANYIATGQLERNPSERCRQLNFVNLP